MASRYNISSNPFDDDEEDDYAKKDTHNNYSNAGAQNSFNDRHEKLMMKIDNSENNQLDSTHRALASIYESEAMGTATAEELIRQGETLDNIENRTQNMQQNLTTTQKHLNNIKSVFGGIKNWWNKDKPSAIDSGKEENANTRLRTTVKTLDSQPPERQKPDMRGFVDDDEDLDSKFMAGSRMPEGASGGYKVISPVTRSAREEEIDSNLDLMCSGMARLKGLAAGLGDEIERQNDQLDRINVNVEKTDDILANQNTQMRKILKR